MRQGTRGRREAVALIERFIKLETYMSNENRMSEEELNKEVEAAIHELQDIDDNRIGAEDLVSYPDGFGGSSLRPSEQMDISKEEEILRPPHYTHGRAFETLHVIEDWELDRDYYLGNAIKYISRYNRKGSVDDPLSCLKKAIFYLQRKVDRMEGKM